MSTPSTATVEYWKKEMIREADLYAQSIQRFGDRLFEAKKNLTSVDFDELVVFLTSTRDFTQSDIRAALAVAKGELDSRLFPSGVRSSKVLNLKSADQQRLLDGEVFKVYDNTGEIRETNWFHMRPDERSRLLGPKGRAILPITEQAVPDVRGRYTKVLEFDGAYVTSKKERLTLTSSSGSKEAAISIADLRAGLSSDELKYLIEELG